jgi:hypothetical protein
VGIVPRVVTLTCTTGGASATAEVTVSAPAVGETAAYSQTGVVVEDATAITLPGGAEITPTVGTSLAEDDEWVFVLTPSGYEYSPVSDNFESVTLYVYYDGLLHKLTGCFGTWSMEAVGGEYAKFTFNFTGNYVAPTDTALPSSPGYESQKPAQVELATLSLSSTTGLVASRFAVDIANDIQIREDINAADAFSGAKLVGRTPTVSFDPEAVLEATHSFWADLAAGTESAFVAKVGNVKGNVVSFECPKVQETNLQYGNRNTTRTYEVTMAAARNSGNDELKVSFR